LFVLVVEAIVVVVGFGQETKRWVEFEMKLDQWVFEMCWDVVVLVMDVVVVFC
jgi:hypothetical protein